MPPGPLHRRDGRRRSCRRRSCARRPPASGPPTSTPTAISISCVAPRDGHPIVLRNNGDGTFTPRDLFRGVTRARGFVWADLDGEGVPDAAFLDDGGRRPRVPQPARRQLPRGAAAARRTGAPSRLRRVGDQRRLARSICSCWRATARSRGCRATPRDGTWTATALSRVDPPPGLAAGRRTAPDRRSRQQRRGRSRSSPARRRRASLLGGAGGSFTPLDGGAAARRAGRGRSRRRRHGSSCSASIQTGSPVARVEHGHEAVPLAGASPARRDGDRRSADQLVRHRRRDRGALRPAPAEAGHHVAARALRSRRGDARRGRPHHLAERRAAGGVRHAGRPDDRRRRSASRGRARGCSPGTDARWRSSPTCSGARRSGLRINAQATADVLMTEDWVKVRGDQLAPRDGAYDLRITAELWETHFFDLVSLLVVDHPAGTRGLRRRALRGAAAEAAGRSPPGRCSRSRRCATIAGRDVSELAAARDDRAIVDFAGRGAVSGHHARRTSSRWSCPTRRRAPARSGSSRRAGFIRPTARSTSRSARASHDAPAGPVAAGRRRGGPLPRRPHGSRLSGRQGQDDPARSHGALRRDGTAAPAPRHEPRDLLGSAGLGGRPAGRRDRSRAGSSCASADLAYPRLLGHRTADAERARASALHAGGHGAALARSRGLLHALRRRPRAAADRSTIATSS